MGKLTKLEDIITFGKYKDRTVEDVYFEDAKYLMWLIAETDRTDFRKFLLKNIEIAAWYQRKTEYTYEDQLLDAACDYMAKDWEDRDL